MKSKILLTIFMLMFAHSVQALDRVGMQTATIKGRIENPKGSELRIRYSKFTIHSELVDFTIPLDENGEFEALLQTPGPCVVDLNQNRKIVQVYLEPKDELYIEFDRSNLKKVPSFSGRGSENNRFFSALNLEAGHRFRLNYKGLGVEKFRKTIDQRRQTRLLFLARNRDKYKLTKSFIDYCLADINYEWALSMLHYPRNYLVKNGFEPVIPSDYYAFIQNMDLNNESALICPTYRRAVEAHFGKIFTEEIIPYRKNNPSSPRSLYRYDLASEQLEGKVRYFFQAGGIIQAFQFNDIELAERYFSDFKKHNPYPEYTNIIETIRQDVMALTTGQPAPNFTLTDLHDSEVSLNDYQGSVVFLDFWASWCGPCIGNLPYLERIKEKTQGEKIIFLNVSLDTDSNAWKNMIKQRNIDGIHVRAEGWTSQIAQQYNIRFLPNYFLIDPNGNISERFLTLSDTDQIANQIRQLQLKN